METNETLETTESTEINFGKEIAKSFVISTAVSAGVLAGFMAVGLAVNKFESIKKSRQEKKAAKLDATTEA